MELLLWIIAIFAALLVVVLIIACAFLTWKLLDYRKRSAESENAYRNLYDSFKDIIDRDAEIAHRDQAIAQLESNRVATQTEIDLQRQSFAKESAQAQQSLTTMRNEIAALEETLDAWHHNAPYHAYHDYHERSMINFQKYAGADESTGVFFYPPRRTARPTRSK